MAKKLTNEQKRGRTALGGAMLLAAGSYWILPGAHWAVFVIAGIIGAIAGYQVELDWQTKHALADQDQHR